MGLDFSKEISEMYAELGTVDWVEQGVDLAKDDWVVIQPYNDFQAIILRNEMDDDGNQVLKVDITDTVLILPKKENTLDILKGGKKDGNGL